MRRGERGRPRALGRHRGATSHPRRRGVYQYHRHAGWHPHPHSHAARRRLVETPRSTPGTLTPPPLQHHQLSASERRLSQSRRSAPSSEIGQIIAYDAASNTATVLVLGSATRVVGPVAVTSCAPRDLTMVGASCLVVLLDAYNPRDGVVVALWPAVTGAALGAKLTQSGVATINVVGASTAGATVAFPSAYAGAPVVVATPGDASWTASVSGIGASGFTLTIRAATPLTATVPVEWIAHGM